MVACGRRKRRIHLLAYSFYSITLKKHTQKSRQGGALFLLGVHMVCSSRAGGGFASSLVVCCTCDLAAALQALTRQARQAVLGYVGLSQQPGSLFLPYAQLVCALLDSSPPYAINYGHAMHPLREPFLSLPSYRKQEGVLKDLVRGNVLMVRPFSSWTDVDESRYALL